MIKIGNGEKWCRKDSTMSVVYRYAESLEKIEGKIEENPGRVESGCIRGLFIWTVENLAGIRNPYTGCKRCGQVRPWYPE
jgi:hypothetical protein